MLPAADKARETLLAEDVPAKLLAHDATLWGPDAESEAAVRLGWLDAVAVSRELLPELLALRDALRSEGVDQVVLCGMGGSSLAPEVICKTAGLPLTVLDSTHPDQVRAALSVDLAKTVVVVSSKSGGTLETDSQRRVFVEAFTAAGIDAASRIVVVTDPGSPFSELAEKEGYRAVFLADPNVGGRYSALTAFGLVPSALAGVDVQALLDSAASVDLSGDNPALLLGAALGGSGRDKVAIDADGSDLPGFGDWAEQLIAESTGKSGTGLLPVVVEPDAPEVQSPAPDVHVVRIGGAAPDAGSAVAGGLGAQFLAWEYATAVAGRLLGIDPFDQPDVESAKKAARGLLDSTPGPDPADFVEGGVEVRATPGLLDGQTTVEGAVDVLLQGIDPRGYLAVMAYVDRLRDGALASVRAPLAARTRRPVTFGWGPRFLHSTGQFHKGGTPVGSFLQITGAIAEDLAIPDQEFTFGELIAAQAAGDAKVLADHGRPVLRLHVADAAGLEQVRALLT
ncbi:MAG: glucose-6-phosphate isomerase [Actinobacteria bacterium]|nr:glucose-6-phosphate isomerase [Actinomycetota bacterium]MCA1720454.1 glucose-6-phosphate isomerase [Actinomycetota bacterium]